VDRGFAPRRTAAALRDSISRRHRVLGKRVREVIGVYGHCFEVTGRRGTHRGGCSTVMPVGRRGAPVRGRPMVAGGWVRGRGGVRRSQVAREGRGEVRDRSERAGVGDAFMAKDELSVGARGQSLVGGWLGARACRCSRDFMPLEEALANGVVNRSAQLSVVMNGATDGRISVGPQVKLR
jgi:hypothetical protein